MNGEEYLELGLIYVKERAWSKAMASFYQAERSLKEQNQKIPAALDSFLGLTLAMVGQRLEEALARCEKALDQAFYQPDYYFNLGKVYLAIHDKALAVQTFRLGLQLDERHPWIQKEMKRLGIRKSPLVKILPRNHFLNKHLGKIQSKLRGLN